MFLQSFEQSAKSPLKVQLLTVRSKIGLVGEANPKAHDLVCSPQLGDLLQTTRT